MELSILIAKIISVIYISTGIAVLIGTINFKDIVNCYDTVSRGNGTVGSITWFNAHKPGLQSRTLSCVVYSGLLCYLT